MTKQALIELRDKVVAGNLNSTELGVLHGCMSLKGYWVNDLEFNRDQKKQVFLSYNGSLDAAVAFLEAVLPGWDWMSAVDAHGERYFVLERTADVYETEETYGDTPARALLLAALDALIARAE